MGAVQKSQTTSIRRGREFVAYVDERTDSDQSATSKLWSFGKIIRSSRAPV